MSHVGQKKTPRVGRGAPDRGDPPDSRAGPRRKPGRPKGRVAGSLRWEENREGVPKTSVWRERVRAELVILHPWLAGRVPWSERHVERYARALRTWVRDPAQRKQWVRYANTRAERWLQDRESDFIPWTVSRFLCDQLEAYARDRGWSAPPPRRSGAPRTSAP